MKIAICDNDYSTCNLIEETVNQYARNNGISIETDIFQTAKSLYQNFENSTDLLFLDVQLPDASGIKIGHFLRKHAMNYHLEIVFISGNPGYALELFKIHPMDFLVKPFSDKDIIDILDEYTQKVRPASQGFLYKFKTTTRKVAYQNILYFSSESRKVHIHIKMAKPSPFIKSFQKLKRNFQRKFFGEYINRTS